MKTLDDINKILGSSDASDLQLIIADVKAAIAASGDGLLAAKQVELDAAVAQRDAAMKKCEAILAKATDPAATKEDIDAEARKAASARSCRSNWMR